MKIFRMRPKMIRKVVNPRGQKRDLDFGRSGVALALFEFVDYFFFVDHDFPPKLVCRDIPVILTGPPGDGRRFHALSSRSKFINYNKSLMIAPRLPTYPTVRRGASVLTIY